MSLPSTIINYRMNYCWETNIKGHNDKTTRHSKDRLLQACYMLIRITKDLGCG